MKGNLAAALFFAAGLAAGEAVAAERFGLFVGTNLGTEGDPRLRWAEADAARAAELFRALGNVPEANLLVLAGADPDRVRAAIAAVERRIERVKAKGERVELVVY